MDALERIEVAIRTQVSQTMSEVHGPHWFMEARHFVSRDKHTKFIERVKNDIGHDPSRARVRTVFIKHYYDKYRKPELPASWMMLDPKILASWLHSLSYLRNLAAHHQRLWNRVYTITPIAAKRYAEDLHDATRFYAQAVVVQVLLKVISPHSTWGDRLSSLLNSYPAIQLQRLGFPDNWHTRDVWLQDKQSLI